MSAAPNRRITDLGSLALHLVEGRTSLKATLQAAAGPANNLAKLASWSTTDRESLIHFRECEP